MKKDTYSSLAVQAALQEKEMRDMRAALENEKRDGKEREMRAALKNEKRDRQSERKDLEQKMEHMLMKMQAALEKRDLEQKMERMQAQAALEKRDLEQQMANVAVRAEIEKVTRNIQDMELRHQLKQEQKDRKAQRQLQELQHLIESQHMHSNVQQRPFALQSSATDNMQQRARQAEMDAAAATKQAQLTRREADRQKEIEEQMIRARAEGAALTKTLTSPPVHKKQQQVQASTSQGALLSEAKGHQAPVQAEMRRQIASDKRQTHASKTGTPQAAALSSSPIVPKSIAQPPNNSDMSKQNTAPKQQEVRMSQQQQSHTRAVKSRVNTGAVRLPGGVASHFFLSHCQSTGGDQTNAIYLELRQMGFTCWYAISMWRGGMSV
jgi:hypothetical protein